MKEGYEINARIWTLAQGFEVAREVGLFGREQLGGVFSFSFGV